MTLLYHPWICEELCQMKKKKNKQQWFIIWWFVSGDDGNESDCDKKNRKINRKRRSCVIQLSIKREITFSKCFANISRIVLFNLNNYDLTRNKWKRKRKEWKKRNNNNNEIPDGIPSAINSTTSRNNIGRWQRL